MLDEEAFIREILDDPRDPLPRQVYADWLEEQADELSLRRAEYLRLHCQMKNLKKSDDRWKPLYEQFLTLRLRVGHDWWRAIDMAHVDYCPQFEYECPRHWENLKPTEDTAVRYCHDCEKQVHYAYTLQQARDLANAGECVAIDSRLMIHSFRDKHFPIEREELVMGLMVFPEDYHPPKREPHPPEEKSS